MINKTNIVIDTNVLLSAIYSNLDYICSIGKKNKIFYLWKPKLKDSNDDFLLKLAVQDVCTGEKISLNQFIVNALSEKVSALQTVDIIEKKASKKDFLNTLSTFS